jgi:hypothetical protein
MGSRLLKKEEKFKCDFCKKIFARESTLFAHMCDKKYRSLNRDEKYVKLGFMVYCRFYELSYQSSKPRTYDHFMESRFYTSFTKFGRYLLHINAINPTEFIDFVIKAGLPINRWESSMVYETYIRELNKKETASAAVERNILLMQQWATDTNEPWCDFFRKISPSLATLYIRSGRISPWVLYTASSSGALLDRLSNEQHDLIKDYVDPKFWKIKFERHRDDVSFLKQLLEEAGV